MHWAPQSAQKVLRSEATALIASLGKESHWTQALHTLAELRVTGPKPDAVLLGAAVAACGRGKAWQHALELLDETQRLSLPDLCLWRMCAQSPPFDMASAVPLVTGGGSGIGLGLAEEFLKLGATKVLISSRREEVLKAAAEKHAGKIHYLVSDAGKEQDRAALLKWVESDHPDCNVLVNNAGIQRRVAPATDEAPWSERAAEIEINFAGPVHLCALFTPHLLKQKQAMLANVSSGLAFVPFTAGPVYGATKAALHSYTLALRYSLEQTSLRVVEIVPPAVKSNLGGSHDFGEECDVFCAAVMERVAAGELEVGFGFSESGRLADRVTNQQAMVGISKQMNVQTYAAA
ncbi:unnamed protein product [Polarella glacialis]|uniref:Ketoreductase domain-containing protein n=1 Tax=Polarella glacialis TaxID=89957 RepID=A0A813LQI6_POLGL|nr:unnamed protein product [Polarella glacialis]